MGEHLCERLPLMETIVAIWTNTFCHLNKYIRKCKEIHFALHSESKVLLSHCPDNVVNRRIIVSPLVSAVQ